MVGLSNHGKRLVAQAMYWRGCEFLQASVLLQNHSGYSFVCTHLMCQGLEIVLKSLLLFRDYDKYRPILHKLRHNFVHLADEVSSIYALKPMSKDLRNEIVTLNNLYKTHFLRYGDARDLTFDPNSIQDTHLTKKVVAWMRLGRRQLRRP